MPRAEQIISRIRQTLSHYVDQVPDGAADLAREYAAKVDEVNHRLDRCVGLLRQGLRSEAVHQAEMSPSVLEEATALEFPERESWAFLVEGQNLGVVPAVNTAAAEELNEAYPRERQLEELLRRHRRLAIGRGPLRARIKVLRRLSQVDMENPVWGEDLATFERARHKQIESEIAQAWHSRDVPALIKLHKECCVEPWLEPPPRTLAQAVEAALTKSQSETLRNRLASLVQQIDAAFQSQDAGAVQSNLDQWKQVATSLGGEKFFKTDSIRDAEEWLSRLNAERQVENDFQRACQSLEAALDNRRPLPELERLWATLIKDDRAVPKTLQTRLESRRMETELESKRRFGMRLTAIIGCVLLAAGLVGYAIYRQAQSAKMDRWQKQLEPLVAAKQWMEASKLIDQLKVQEPALWSSPGFQAIDVEVSKGMEEEKGRHSRFEAAIVRAEKAGVETPDKAALEEAEALANTGEEKLRFETFRGRVEAVARQAQMGRDQAFTVAMDDIRKRFTEIRDQKDPSAENTVKSLLQIKADTARLLGSDGISPALKTTAQTIGASINALLSSMQDRVTRQNAISQDLQVIEKLYDKPLELDQRLQEFIKKYPEHSLSGDFQKSVKLLQGWQSIELCAPAMSNLVNFHVTDYEETMGQIKEMDELAKQPVGVYKRAIENYRSYLERAKIALDPANLLDKPDGDVQRLLSNDLIDGLNVVRTRAGTIYYMLKKDPMPNSLAGQIIILKYVANANQVFGKEPPAQKNLNANEFATDMQPSPSPQVAFAANARKYIAENRKQWETAYLALCQLLAGQKDVDPVLKVAMMSQLAGYAVDRDWPQSKEIKDWASQMDATNTNVNWMDPADAEAEKARVTAREVLGRQPDFDGLRKAYSEWERQMRVDLAVRKPIGLIWREGNIISMTPATELKDGRLEVVVAEDDGTTRLELIGQVKRGKISWLESALKQPAGSIVYTVP